MQRDGLAVVQHQKRIISGALSNPLGWRVNGVIRELKGAMVNGDTGLCCQDLVGPDSFIGGHVDRRHEPARLVGSNWQQRQAGRSEALPDVTEVLTESGVTGEIDHAPGGFDHVATPQRPVAIEHSASGKMQRRHAVDLASGEWKRMAPVQFLDRADVLRSQQGCDSGRDDELGRSTIRQPAQAVKIQMVVVIVTNEHDVDSRKIFESHAWFAATPGTDGGKRAGPFRPDRIGQDVGVTLLKQNGGVVHERNAQLIGRHGWRRFGRLDIIEELGRRLCPAGEFPSQDIQKTSGLGRVRIEEAFSVEVGG